MDIVVEPISEDPAAEKPPEGRPDTLEEAQLAAVMHVSTQEHPEEAP